jgi:serine/threonine protein kinase
MTVQYDQAIPLALAANFPETGADEFQEEELGREDPSSFIHDLSQLEHDYEMGTAIPLDRYGNYQDGSHLLSGQRRLIQHFNDLLDFDHPQQALRHRKALQHFASLMRPKHTQKSLAQLYGFYGSQTNFSIVTDFPQFHDEQNFPHPLQNIDDITYQRQKMQRSEDRFCHPLWVAQATHNILQGLLYLHENALTLTNIHPQDIALTSLSSASFVYLQSLDKLIPLEEGEKEDRERHLLQMIAPIMTDLLSPPGYEDSQRAHQDMTLPKMELTWLRYGKGPLLRLLHSWTKKSSAPSFKQALESLEKFHRYYLARKKDLEEFPFQYGQRFSLQGLLGKGGFGKVFRAYDRKLDRDIALKIVPIHDLQPHLVHTLIRSGLHLLNLTENGKLPDGIMHVFGIYPLPDKIISVLQLIENPESSGKEPKFDTLEEYANLLYRRWATNSRTTPESDIAQVILRQLQTTRSLLRQGFMATDMRNANFLASRDQEQEAILVDADGIVTIHDLTWHPFQAHIIRAQEYFLPEGMHDLWKDEPDKPRESTIVYSLALNLLDFISNTHLFISKETTVSHPPLRSRSTATNAPSSSSQTSTPSSRKQFLQDIATGKFHQSLLSSVRPGYEGLKDIVERALSLNPRKRPSLNDFEKALLARMR